MSTTLPEGVDLAELENLAASVASAAGELILRRPDDLGLDTKSTRTDLVTEMDQRSQRLLVDLITAARPGDAVQGEEQAEAHGDSGITWVVDPIDGTVNYVYGLPDYSVSVAAVVGDPSRHGQWSAVAAAVMHPATQEVYVAHRGGGARLRSPEGVRTLVASEQSDLGMALVGTGFGYDAGLRLRQASALADLIGSVRDIRRIGSAALDLCRVATGTLDAYYETGLHAWDHAAGALILQEAGCVVGGLDDGYPDGQLTWAAAPGLADEFSALARQVTRTHIVVGPQE